MTHDTMETAFAKAQEAQRRGLNTVTLLIEARRKTMALRIDVASYFSEGKDSGAEALVVRRLKGDPFVDGASGTVLPGVIDTLVVVVNVSDVFSMARSAVEREMKPPSPVRRRATRRSFAHLMSR